MKRFFFHLLKIIVPIVLFFLVLEIAIRKIPNDYQLKKEYLNHNSTKINTLILGSSHTFYGLNPTYFSKNTFNAAYVSQTLDLDLEILKIQQPKLKNLKTIILPISYFSLFETLETDVEKWRIKNYVLYYGFENKYKFTDHFETLNNDVSLHLKKAIKHYVLKKSYITSSNLGFGTRFKTENKKEFKGKFTAKKHTVKDFSLYKKNLNSLCEIIAICRKNNIKILFITTPTHSSYYKNLNTIQLEKTLHTISNLVKKNTNCSYFNFLQSNLFTNEDFYDADHLNEAGAKKLSIYLNQKINSQ